MILSGMLEYIYNYVYTYTHIYTEDEQNIKFFNIIKSSLQYTMYLSIYTTFMLYNVNIICTDLIYLNHHFYFYRKEIEDINIRNRNIIV